MNKHLKLLTFVLLVAVNTSQASTPGLKAELHCTKSLRAVWGNLTALIDLEEGLLEYEMEKKDVFDPEQTFHIKGSNNLGGSTLQKSVAFSTSVAEGIQIIAKQSYYLRPIAPIVKTIVIHLKKNLGPSFFLGNYELISFSINGKFYELNGALCSLYPVVE